ncbi:predicted protein [Streptomyces sp. SPB78]|nr:predicted protein [Streptomyces sp. SPB78]
MFARCPGLFIQDSMTAAASAWPRAMFSPPRFPTPAWSARSQGVSPSGSVWSKKPRAAMSSLKAVASEASAPSARTALHPTLARSWLTSARTAAAAALSSPLGAAATGGCAGACDAGFVLTGVALFGGVAVRVVPAPGDVPAPVPPCFLVTEREGLGVAAALLFFSRGEADAAREGASERVAPRLAAGVVRSAADASSPCPSPDGASAARTFASCPPPKE